MKKARSGLFLFALLVVFASWALFEWYTENSKLDTLHKDTFNTVYLVKISDQENHYVLISNNQVTFKIIKEYAPKLTWSDFEGFDFNKPLTIESYNQEVSKLIIEPDQVLLDINYLELQKQEIREGPFAAFIAFSIMSLIIGLLSFFLPNIESWTRNKVENGIMKINGVKKVKDFLFELEVEGIKILILHDFSLAISKYGNKSFIKVFIPIDVKEKLHIKKLKVDYFEKNKYYSFIHNIPFSVNHKALERKIKSKLK